MVDLARDVLVIFQIIWNLDRRQLLSMVANFALFSTPFGRVSAPCRKVSGYTNRQLLDYQLSKLLSASRMSSAPWWLFLLTNITRPYWVESWGWIGFWSPRDIDQVSLISPTILTLPSLLPPLTHHNGVCSASVDSWLTLVRTRNKDNPIIGIRHIKVSTTARLIGFTIITKQKGWSLANWWAMAITKNTTQDSSN